MNECTAAYSQKQTWKLTKSMRSRAGKDIKGPDFPGQTYHSKPFEKAVEISIAACYTRSNYCMDGWMNEWMNKWMNKEMN